MPIIILIPTLICIVALFRGSLQKTFLDVFVPIFMLFPIYYFWKVAALPPLTWSEAALVPIGIAIVLKEMPRWRLNTMDVWMGLFLFTSCYSDYLAGHSTAYIFDLFYSMFTGLVPYMIGKVLIEQQGARVATVKRMVFLLFLCCIISAYEYKMGQNPFTLFWARYFPGETFSWKTQIRWGFGRVSGPFGQSELAGMMLFFGLVLALWLSYNRLWEPKFSRFRGHPFTKSAIICWTIGFSLLMTQARGPWLGCIVAVPIAFIGRSDKILRRSVITIFLVGILGGLAYVGLKHYTSGPVSSDEQETAQYRQQLVPNYLPIAKRGGPWGWGQDFPQVPGQESIDNEYLFVALTQGWVGLLAFAMLCLETIVRLIVGIVLAPDKSDRYFAFSLLGVWLGLLLTLYTVFLGNQPYVLVFLMMGWAQSLPRRKHEEAALSFEQVHT